MKKTEIGLLAGIAALTIILMVTNFSKSDELTCLRLFKEVRDLEDSVDFNLAEFEAIKKHAELVVEYVDTGCPEFDQLEFRYNHSRQILEKMNSDPITHSSTYQIGSFEISTTIINGSINNITKSDDRNSILIEISPFNQGNLTIKIPKTMLKAINDDYSKFSFFVISDDEETNYEQIDSETIKINFQNNTKKIEITGASRLN